MARNGYLAEDGIRLVTVEDDDRLIATAAASFLAMKAEAARAGVALSIVEPAGAYRTAWVQNDMVDHPERYNLNPNSVIKFSRYGQSHGWGNRIDVNQAALPWMLANAARFGWSREYGTRDPNHFKHDGTTAVTGAGGGGNAFDDLGDEEVTYGIRNDFPDATILPGLPKGAVLIGHGTFPLVWVTNAGPEDINGVEIAGWNAQQIAERISQVGIRGSGADLGKVFKSLQDAQSGSPTYVLGASSGGGAFTLDAATIQALAAANASAFFAEQKKPGN